MQIFRRRLTVAALASGALAPLASLAQQPQAARRIGVLATARRNHPFLGALQVELRRLGYVEGKNIAIEWRLSEGKDERLPAFAQELLALNSELIVAHGNESVVAIKQATRTVPVVMFAASHPVESGFVESLARPGGNVTGAVWSGAEQIGKVLQTLKEAAPGAVRVAMLWNPTYRFAHLWKAEADRAASLLGLNLQYYYVTRLDEVELALKQVAAARPDALCLGAEAIMNAKVREIATFATEHKLMSISINYLLVNNNGLLYYGPSLQAIIGRTASFVDRILRGTKPADLPVELPTKYELVINAKTARTIGYKIPQSLLQRADRVIE